MSRINKDTSKTKNASNPSPGAPSRDSVVERIVGLSEDEVSSVVGDREHQLRRLIQTLRNRKGRFALIFVVCNEVPLRRKLTQQIKETLSTQDIFELHLTDKENSLLDNFLKAPGDPHPLFVYGIENLLPSSDKQKLRREETLQELQLRREQFHSLNRPLVLWMPEYVYTLIGQQAVDFWSWQSGTFFFTDIQSRKVRLDLISETTGEVTEEVQRAILQDAHRAARNRLEQLPAPPRDFTGREAELAELRQALCNGGMTISGVQGMGGVGKTALALVLANEFKDQYPDAQIYLDLKGVSEQPFSTTDAMWHVVNSFHPDMKRPDDAELPVWYHDLLNRHRALLFYDNAKDAQQIEPLLPPENCLLLITSRKHFQMPGMFNKNLEEMIGPDAEALLLEIAPRIRPYAAAIAKQCGYLPLALRLAASALHKSPKLSPRRLLRRLQDRRKRVELVEASFGLSYELLSEELQRCLRVLAIFPASFDAPAAAAVWQKDVDAARNSLTELEEYSLLDWEESIQRYTLHDLARDFAETRLSAPEREHVGFLHAAHFLQLLQAADNLFLKGGEAIVEGLSLFDNERINIEAGQAWAAQRFADYERAAHLCNSYPNAGTFVLDLRQHPRDYILWLDAGLLAARQLKDRASEGSHLGNLGYAYDDLGERRRAIEFYEQHLAISRELGDRKGEGSALGNLGVTYKHLGEIRRAIEFQKQRLDIAREVGDRRGEGDALSNLGLAYNDLGETQFAIELYERGLIVDREIGNRRGESGSLVNLGNAYVDLGEIHRAIELYEQALTIMRELGDRRGEGSALGNLGNAYFRMGENHRAIELYEQRLDIAREIGDRHGEGTVLGNLGNVYSVLGENRRALELYEQSLTISREIGNRRGESIGLGNMSNVYLTLGDRNKAKECLEAALKISEEIESPNTKIIRKSLEELRGKSE